MRNRIALLTLFFGGVLFGTASCGQDEATGGTSGTSKAGYCEPCDHSNDCASGNVCRSVGDKVGVCAKSTDTQCCLGTGSTQTCHTNLGPNLDGSGGSGGSAGGGIINKGGAGGKTGAGGTSGTPQQTHLGQACVSTDDCVDSALTCIGSTGFTDGTGIPKGMCTMKCTTNGDCSNSYDGAFCLQYNDTDKYCIEGCSTGALGSPKCHQRDEISCGFIGTSPTTTACATNADCGTQQICDSTSGTCGDFITGCIPQCGGDFDCGAKEYCDFGTGLCTKTKPTGLPIGAECTVPTGNAADPCEGFCDAGSDPKHGICEALCVLSQSLAGCGWDGSTPKPDNVCLFGTILSPPMDAVFGDPGICGALCDCNDQCVRAGDVCIDETMMDINAIWGRNGYCRPLETGETMKDTYSECPAGVGSGGAGGESSGSSGTGGSGGTSGTNGSAGAGEGGQPTQAGGSGGEAGH